MSEPRVSPEVAAEVRSIRNRIMEVVTECGGDCDTEAAWYIALNVVHPVKAALAAARRGVEPGQEEVRGSDGAMGAEPDGSGESPPSSSRNEG